MIAGLLTHEASFSNSYFISLNVYSHYCSDYYVSCDHRLLTDEYPFFCFAYKIPQGVPVGLRVSLRGYEDCYYIPVTSYGQPSCSTVLNSLDSIMDDNQ